MISLKHDPTTLIIGATGSIGRAVVQELANSNLLHIRAVTRDSSAAQAFRQQGIEPIHLDLSQYETYAPALRQLVKIT
ncbi:MAG: hypothetical protein CLLPBCKN_001562 [Chroococcidiopsis cubana SAG 39.79]|uniref:NmrA-like domain-containing protein n=1 Tax=Chroococcidiopsis cubana SAG 39.79 TaxID=388085 RepID=A0AB37UC24_9CYAN|nr:NAD(P)H-binding protein [Chroococcidiopsis cubana]MDZ4872174.1 hypothetical protein [Chroococcidiopsis cubana SAG 39.79]RUT04160.1 hypothetical protein DSM107010_58800 [Chroococcidiopsis cubana SAG 39.79]